MNTHRFQLGQFRCVILQDIEHSQTAADMFRNVDAEQLPDIVRAHDWNPDVMSISYNVLAVNTGAEWVMIDSGTGGLTGMETHLRAGLDAAGISPDAITKVFLTHAHVDHYGGLRDQEDRFIFPNAHYFMLRAEWQYWTSDEKMAEIEGRSPQLAEIMRRWVLPLEPCLTLLEDGESFAPGFTTVFAPGHTPGHTAVMIESDGERLLVIGDAGLHPLNLQYPDWQFRNDFDHALAKATKDKLVEAARTGGATIMGYHFPFPGLISSTTLNRLP